MMTLDFMQRVDYWLGHPFCFLATIVEKLCPFLIRNKNSSVDSPTKAVFIELSEMGAAIVAAPAIKKATATYGRENLFFLIFNRNRASVDIQNLFDPPNVLVIDDSSFFKFAVSTIKSILKIRKLNISTAFDLELFSRCTALLAWISGAKHRIGFSSGPDEGPWRGHLFTREVRYNPHIHMSHNFLAMLEVKDSPTDQEYVKLIPGPLPNAERLIPDAELIQKMKDRLSPIINGDIKNLIILNAEAGSLPLRGWPVQSWKELIASLEVELSDYKLIIIGLKSFKETAQELYNASKKINVFDFSGLTYNLSELTALMSISSLLITCDSGPAHFASLVDLPTIALFGPETPALYKPLGSKVHVIFQGLSCSPCFSAYNHRQSHCTDNVCLKSISVEQVKNTALKILKT